MFFLFVCFFPSFINALRNLHFNLIRTDLDCSSVAFSHNKTVANTISPLFVRKLSMLQNYFTFFFLPPPLLWHWAEVVFGFGRKLQTGCEAQCELWVLFPAVCHGSDSLFVMGWDPVAGQMLYGLVYWTCYTKGCAPHWQAAGGL